MTRLPRPSVPFNRRKSELMAMTRLQLIEIVNTHDREMYKNVPSMSKEQLVAYILGKEEGQRLGES